MWSLKDDRKVWDDIRVIRKLRPLRNSEKASARAHYKMIQAAYRKRSRMASPIYEFDVKSKDRLEGFKIPDNLVCPLCGKVMVDPVMVSTGQHGHFCPVTYQPISPIVLRNERARGYLVEWREAELEVEADSRAPSTKP
uniref:U-box domain-containing protein n=1 Tax=Oryza punctata TaxID=4537 RepID=A0A0E0LSM1_ORYPU